MADWREAIEAEWRRRAAAAPSGSLFPLIQQSFDHREIVAMVDAILSGRITMGERVLEFERRFAAAVGAPYAVMVNSGSSANLLALSVASNPARSRSLVSGDEVLLPAVCWATSLWPVVQSGLTPVFVDVDPRTLNMDMADMRRRVTARTRAILTVHVLGNSAPMGEMLDFAQTHALLLIEDSCEALGSRALGRWLGTLGALGTYSFYYSHHITTGEGGMVVCQTSEDADLLRCLRAHGWSRDLSNRPAVEGANPDVDPRFLFVNTGYNFRPMEVQGAMGLHQLDRLPTLNACRLENHARLASALRAHPRWNGQLQWPEAAPGTEPVWFGLPFLLAEPHAGRRGAYLAYLSEHGVEHRPIIGGNFTRQPALRALGMQCDPSDYPGAEIINRAGFFIGLHTNLLADPMVAQLADILLGFDF